MKEIPEATAFIAAVRETGARRTGEAWRHYIEPFDGRFKQAVVLPDYVGAMTWSYSRNGLYIAHQLRATTDGRIELLTVDFDGFAKVEPVADEYAGIARQMELERNLLRRGWALEEFAGSRRRPVPPPVEPPATAA